MKTKILIFIFCISGFYGQAQLPRLKRVVPMFWWTGMVNPKLQLLVYGDRISDSHVSLKYEGVTLEGVDRVENPNYLFINLVIGRNTPAGKIDIVFSQKGKKTLHYHYELKARDTSSDRIQGVTSKDLIYLLMPDRFSDGDLSNDRVPGMEDQSLNRDSMYDRHGGDIQGIINHLDYIKHLGATAIWCTPMVENDMPEASYHGYAATDLYRIDPRFGTNELYKAYVARCHAMGLKVIKDVVHNHVGTDSWLIKDMPMKSWVHQWDRYTNTNYRDQPMMDPHASAADRKLQVDGWFVPTMADLNENNPYVATYLIENNIWWIEYAGIDGLRLDTYPYNDPGFMAKWAIAMRTQFPHLSIFGETLVTWPSEQAFFTGGNTVNRGFDTHLPGVTDAALKDAIYEALNGKEGWTDGVNRLYAVLSQDFLYKEPMNNCVFLDNHDMNRFFSMVGENLDKFEEGIGILLTVRGIPEIYYGTEILMKNFSAPDGLVREDFPGGWPTDSVSKFSRTGRTAEENRAFDIVSALAAFRKSSSALQTGKMMQFVPENGVYVYFRYDSRQTVMIIVNSNDGRKMLDTKRFSERSGGFKRAKNVITGEQMSQIDSINVKGHSTTVLELLR
jgi:glycosidase